MPPPNQPLVQGVQLEGQLSVGLRQLRELHSQVRSGAAAATAPPPPPSQLQQLQAAPMASDENPDRLAARRESLSTWYSFHVPLTWALFVTAMVHVVGALYYATLQR